MVNSVQWVENGKIGEKAGRQLADLLFDTDEFISQALFVNREVARIVIPRLFETGKDPVFNLDNLSTLRNKENDILALVLGVRGSHTWEPTALAEVYAEYAPDVDYSSIYELGDTLDGDSDSCAYLHFLSVNPDYQGIGFGTTLLGVFKSSNLKSDLVLHVLQDNDNAIKVYENFGFVKTAEMEGFGLIVRPFIYEMVLASV